MPTLPADYFTAYHNVKLTRDSKGVLVAELHIPRVCIYNEMLF